MPNDMQIALGLSVAAAVALGFSRFAYALLLPPMREAFRWTYAEAGALNTANAIGYVAGALVAAAMIRRIGAVAVFRAGLLATTATLPLAAVADGFWGLLVVRGASGVAMAFAFISGGTLAAGMAPASENRRGAILLGIYVAGAGIGIAASGVAVPLALKVAGGSWRAGWLAMGALAAAGTAPAWVAAGTVPVHGGGRRGEIDRVTALQLAPIIAGYGLFGMGYAGFITFVIALLRDQGGSPVLAAVFWATLGLASASGTIWLGDLLGRLRGGRGLALVSVASAFGMLPVLIWPGIPAAFASALLFGGSFLGSAAASAVAVRQQLPPPLVPAGLGLLTVSFALGQVGGPVLSGLLADIGQNVAVGMWCSPAMLGLAATLSLLQHSADEVEERSNCS